MLKFPKISRKPICFRDLVILFLIALPFSIFYTGFTVVHLLWSLPYIISMSVYVYGIYEFNDIRWYI